MAEVFGKRQVQSLSLEFARESQSEEVSHLLVCQQVLYVLLMHKSMQECDIRSCLMSYSSKTLEVGLTVICSEISRRPM